MSERESGERTWFPSFLETLAIHDQVMLRYTGSTALRDEDGALLHSALRRPQQAAYYEEDDVIAQAGSLLWGLIRNHPFEDGNKRTAVVLTCLFLERNGYTLQVTEDELVDAALALAAGEWNQEQTERWLRVRAVPKG